MDNKKGEAALAVFHIQDKAIDYDASSVEVRSSFFLLTFLRIEILEGRVFLFSLQA